MAKNILVVTGSPRKHGNSAALADAFSKGAEACGATVHRFDAAFHKLSGCLACDHCWQDSVHACVIPDDFNVFISALQRADAVVFAYPLYWSGMPAQLKMIVDRLYSYCVPQCPGDLHGKLTANLLCCECEGDENFALVRKMHEGLNGYMHWQDAGEVAVHTCYAPGEILQTDGPARAYALGQRLAAD